MSYIRLDRKITEWGWFTDSNTLKVWVYLLVNAQYHDSVFKGIEVKRGQLVTGRKKLAERLEMSESQVRTCLEHLVSTNEITINSTNKYSVITIVKYGIYQGGDDDDSQQNDQQDSQQIANESPTNRHNTRSKEGKKTKYIFIKPSLEEVREYCKERNKGVDADRWFNYYSANGWKVGKNSMKDWKASVRTWETNNKPKKEDELKSSERYAVPW